MRYGRSNNAPTKQSKILLEFTSLISKLKYNCLSFMIKHIQNHVAYQPLIYNHSLTEKYEIPDMRTLKCGSIHKKVLITLTSAKPAQRPNILYCVKA